jgi:hypothetical protein
MVVEFACSDRSHRNGSFADPLVIRARVGLCDYFELVNFQANGRTAPAATALIASPIKNGTTPFAIAQAIVLPVV